MQRTSDTYEDILGEFCTYLKLEQSMSDNSIAGYASDIGKFFTFLKRLGVAPEDTSGQEIQMFLEREINAGSSKRSQARTMSAIRSLFRFLRLEGRMDDNPGEAVSSPKINPIIPTVLSVGEVLATLESVDLSRKGGHRDRAILEVLYSCGLRVSELTALRISDIFPEEGFIRVTGKGKKQRLVPIGSPALEAISLYRRVRDTGKIAKGAEDILFLNRSGRRMSRVAVFNIVKKQASAAGITKEISPHTFRHSFATHLVENGADLRVVQQMLGHESILTTEIYTHVDAAKWRKTILKYHPMR